MLRLTALTLSLIFSAAALADDARIAARLDSIGVKSRLDKDGFIVGISSNKSSVLTPDDYKAIGGLSRLKSLILYIDCSLTDETLASLAGLPALEEVQIDGAKLTDEGMKHFATMKNLNRLTFFHVLNKGKFSGAGLAHLADLPKFESFGCGGSTFDDRGLKACGKLTGLKTLHIWHTPITNDGVRHLKSLTKLKDLRLAPQFNPRISDPVFEHLVQIPSLETLAIQETRLHYDGGLSQLKKLPNLKKLDLAETEISPADLDRLKIDLPAVSIHWKGPTEQQRKWIGEQFDRK